MHKKTYDIELIGLDVKEGYSEEKLAQIVKENTNYIIENDKKCPHFYIVEVCDEIIDDESAEEYLRKIRKLFLMNGVENVLMTTKGLLSLKKVEICRVKNKKKEVKKS